MLLKSPVMEGMLLYTRSWARFACPTPYWWPLITVVGNGRLFQWHMRSGNIVYVHYHMYMHVRCTCVGVRRIMLICDSCSRV